LGRGPYCPPELNYQEIRLSRKFSISSFYRKFNPSIKETQGDFLVRNLFAAFFLGALLCAPAIRAQAGPVEGGHEWQVWTGGGHGIQGSQSGDGVWNAGLRYGLILTRPHGPGFLRGRLEYALDAVPVFLVLQKTNTAYGAGLNPFAFKWMLDTKPAVAPYFEIGGGTLFTNTKVPEGTSRVNFTSSAALGLHFLRARHNISAEVRYMHISSAGLATPNPGINTIQFRVGFGAFSQKE
jgi:fluoride ion exporter CrcB/FEX